MRSMNNASKMMCAAALAACATAWAEPVKIILDTDMYSDYDDVGALACLHALADAGEAEILAVGSCTWGATNRSVAACEIINAYYGRADIPVGTCRHGGREGAGDRGYGLPEKFPQWVKHLDGQTAPDAWKIYRQALAAAPDGSVVMCSLGFMNNLADLLKSAGDEISPLAGRDLVAKKCRLWVCMACNYPDGKEYNSKWDPPASDYAFRNWPTPVIFTDFQYGRYCFAGRAVAELPDEGNPVKEAFKRRLLKREKVVPFGDVKRRKASWDQDAGHPSWDETAILIAVRGWEPYFDLERGMFEMVGTDGDDVWKPDPKSANGRVVEKMHRQDVARILDELMCRPPKCRAVSK